MSCPKYTIKSFVSKVILIYVYSKFFFMIIDFHQKKRYTRKKIRRIYAGRGWDGDLSLGDPTDHFEGCEPGKGGGRSCYRFAELLRLGC